MKDSKPYNALICIASPLQAICAVEAISNFKIKKYKILIIDDGTRLEQTKFFLDSQNIKYFVIPFHVSLWKNVLRMLLCFCPFRGKYDFLLMGDYRLTGHRMEYVPLIKNGGKILYLDDGSYIISWSKGLLVEEKITKLRNRLMSIVCRLRRISDRNIFTVFAKDIDIPNYNIKENRLTQLQMPSGPTSDDIYIIGTNPVGEGGYCAFLGIEISHYYDVLRKNLTEIRNKNKNSHLVYIPHGRDFSEETKTICKELKIEYKKLPVCIELYILSLQRSPKEIWGFGSTALYTLQRLCPKTRLTNITINGTVDNAVEQYREIANLYGKNGIKNVWIK